VVAIKTSTLIFIVVAIILSVLSTVDVLLSSYGSFGLVFVAEELTEKPSRYISLPEPDPYVIRAVSNPGEEIIVGSWENSVFDDLSSSYGTNNVEINGKYYVIHQYSKDPRPFLLDFLLLLVGWITLGIAALVKMIRKSSKHHD